MGRSAEHGHLPPGREPGPQSRRRVRGRKVAFWILASVGLFFLVGGVATWGGLGEESVFVVVVGALVVAGAFGVRRSSWTKRARHLQVTASPPELRRGEPVSVRLDVAAGLRAGAVVEVGLVCSEMYDFVEVTRTQQGRSRTRSTKVVDAHAEWAPARAEAGSQQFAFTVPPGAPYSYEGDCVSYAWRVSARQRTELGRDPVRDAPIWVHP